LKERDDAKKSFIWFILSELREWDKKWVEMAVFYFNFN